MEVKKRISKIIELLDKEYGTDYICFLHYRTPWELLVATVLSAQCTDAHVNEVTPALFEQFPDVYAFAKANLEDVEAAVHSTGFYHNKAKNIIMSARKIVEKYNGEVPSDMESLTALPGVGRKTANVIRGHIFNEPGVVVDTHVKRISKRLGVTHFDDPVKVEFDLMKKLPKDHWLLWNTDLISLGRTICKAPKPKCEECFLKEACEYYAKFSSF